MHETRAVTGGETFAEVMIETLTGKVACDGEFFLDHDARRYVEDLLTADAQRKAIEREMRGPARPAPEAPGWFCRGWRAAG